MTNEQKLDLVAIGNRLRKLRGKLTIDAFSDLLGIHKNTYRNYEKGTRPFGIDVMTELVDVGVDPMWVLKGEGELLIPENELGPGFYMKEQNREFYNDLRSLSRSEGLTQENEIINEESARYREKDHKNKERDPGSLSQSRMGSDIKDYSAGSGSTMEAFAHIPLFDVKASAGNGSVIHEEEETDALMFKREWIYNELHSSPANLYLIYVEGESMEPALRPGDVILVDHTDNIAKRDGIYVIRMGESLLVKRLQRLPNHRLKVTSDNPAYEPFEISLDFDLQNELSIIGRVVWSGRRH